MSADASPTPPSTSEAAQQSELSVWRVYDGWMGNGPVHRIVVARTAEDAARVSREADARLGLSERTYTAERACAAVDGGHEPESDD